MENNKSEADEKKEVVISDDENRTDFTNYTEPEKETEGTVDYAQLNAENISATTFENIANTAKRRRTVRTVGTIIVSSLLVVLFAMAFVLLFLKIDTFQIIGDTRYTQSSIIAASGISKGDNIYSINKYEIEENIIEACPYIKSVYIRRTLPSTLIFTVEEETPMYYFSLAEEYFLLSESMRILEKRSSMAETLAEYPHLVQLNTQTVKRAIVGQKVEFDNEGYIDYASEMLKLFVSSSLGDGITLVDFSNRFRIFFIYAGRFKVEIGDISDVESKITRAELIINKLSNKDKGTINVEIDPAYYIMGDYEL